MPAKARTATAPVATPAPAPAAAAFDWDKLPEATVPEYTRTSNIPKDVESTTPEAIKARVKESYAAFVPKSEGVTQKPSWRTQECGTADMATEFVRLAKRYAAGSDPRMTLRSAILKSDLTGQDSIVRFMAKPFEAKDKS